MAGHGGRRGYPETPYSRPPPRGPHLEEEIAIRNADIRRLLADNARLAEDRHALQRELAAVAEDARRLNFMVKDIQAERDMQNRDLVEKGLKLEAELRAMEPVRNEVLALRGEVVKIGKAKEELGVQVKNLMQELARAQGENKQVPALRAEIEGLRQELMHARTALEYEKKANGELFEQRKSVEMNLVSMAREIEKLRSNVDPYGGEKFKMSNVDPYGGGAGPPYGAKLGSPNRAFPSYGEGYGLHAGSADKAPLYGTSSGSWSTYDQSRSGRR